MPYNFLVTGMPGSGKTTVVQTVINNLREYNLTAGGVYCPEIRRDGERVGFEIVDIMTEKSCVLAHIDRDTGPQVGKYRVDVSNINTICEKAFPRAFKEADFLVVDEVAPMEVYSNIFKEQVRKALDTNMPLVAVIHLRSTSGFIGQIKERPDTELFEVTKETRNKLPKTLTKRVVETINKR